MNQRSLEAARRVFGHLARQVDVPFSVRLWDGTMIPLGREAAADGPAIRVAGPEVLGALLRRPTFDNLFRRYVSGDLDLDGGDLIGFLDAARQAKKATRLRLRDLRRGFPWAAALALLLARDRPAEIRHEFQGGDAPRGGARDRDQEFVQFHYDVSNEFYALFLDPEMVYSCAYFRDWATPLEQAQRDKLDMICRKLRLREGQTFLDIGSGWGALLCHAARHYGVSAHGVTLSQTQYDHCRAKIERLGLKDRVTVSLADYRTLEGRYDRIASIGMYEHVGIANYPGYFRKIHGLLRDGGVFLNHGITRRAKRNVGNFGKVSRGKRVILKYIFPGAELDHLGHTLQVMESCGFEVHDVEGLRRHYARTCRLWHDRLAARRAAAIDLIGPERYRMWLAYLAGVTVGFEHGPMRVYQTVATKQLAAAELPPTRDDLYRRAPEARAERDAA
ncbi:MAG TPA: cyclopropane-fatty-acyl-phospholipid synthase family protein [Geminicoccaceae bacterium]|nr:cyclopropane-fatty-acyl-phospholipid synthase family protein [Geminicoccaceae bacterium]